RRIAHEPRPNDVICTLIVPQPPGVRLPLAYLFFISNIFGDHLLLHSFPTRRSSDLSRAASPSRRCRRIPSRSSSSQRRSVGQRRDRKSTRLNSSHVSISYAVFCLKKKKTC